MTLLVRFLGLYQTESWEQRWAQYVSSKPLFYVSENFWINQNYYLRLCAKGGLELCYKPGGNFLDWPFELTQFAFKFGRAAWSLICSIVSGGSWYSKLLDLLLRPVFSAMVWYGPLGRGGLELVSYLTVRGRNIGEDSLAAVEGGILGIYLLRRACLYTLNRLVGAH